MLATKFRNPFGYMSSQPLTDDQMRKYAPSIFADEAHESRSSRYSYIPTIDIVHSLRKEGFQPFMVCQARTRKPGKEGHTKHMLRLRHPSQVFSDEANEIILINSHDGTSSYQMMAGVMRFVCSNGLVIGENIHDVRVPHKGNIVGEVIEGAYQVLDNFKFADEQRESMKDVSLSAGEKRLLANSALMLKYDTETDPAPVSEDSVLMPRRREDSKDDLWSTFNVLQENLVRGGLNARNKNGRRTRTRAVTGIDGNIKLNRALWQLADGMRKLKQGN